MDIMSRIFAISFSFIFFAAHILAAEPAWIDQRYSLNQMGAGHGKNYAYFEMRFLPATVESSNHKI